MPLGIRITTSRLHRAFVQLDRFSDEKCGKFVLAARGGFWLRLGVRVLLALLFVLVAGGIIGGAIAIYLGVGGTFDERMISGQQRVWLNVGILVCATLGLLAAGLSTLFTRDLWLRGRIRYVLDMRGRCSKCHYGLLGLPISDVFEVRCPECGVTTRVDPSLVELVGGDVSCGRKLVSEDAVEAPDQPTFWTTQRRRFIATWFKRAAIGAVACVGLLIVSAIGWEIFIRVQASRAAKMRPGVATIQQFVESKQPVAYSPGEDAWAVLTKAIELMNRTDTDFRGGTMMWPMFTKSIKATNSQTTEWDPVQGRTIEPGEDVFIEKSQELQPEFVWVMGVPKQENEFDAAYYAACAELARTLIGKYEEAGLYELLRQLPGKRWAVKQLHVNGDEPAINILLPELGGARQLAKVEMARINLALAKGDIETAIDAFEELLALQRVLGQQSWMINRMVSGAIHALAIERIALIAEQANQTQLIRMEEILAAAKPSLSLSDVIEGERLGGVDTLAWIFSNPKRVRFGKYSLNYDNWLFDGMGTGFSGSEHVGFLDQNVEAMNSYYKQIQQQSGMSRSARMKAPATLPANLVLVNQLAATANRFFDAEDLRSQSVVAAQMMLASHRFKLEKGDFPNSRAELESFVGQSFPLDAMTEMPFELQKVDSEKDKFRRAFVVYSVGPDGVDNGGLEASRSPDGYLPAYMRTPSGFDFIFFDPAQR